MKHARITRRKFICSAVATGAVIAFPAFPEIATAAVPVVKPAWAVGTCGEFDWNCFRADTAEEAIRIAAEEYCGEGCTCANYQDERSLPCEYCSRVDQYDATRIKAWDAADPLTGGDWLAAGMGAFCSRCGYETSTEEGGQIIESEAVCDDCMTITDWELIDPEHAAEMREDLKSEE